MDQDPYRELPPAGGFGAGGPQNYGTRFGVMYQGVPPSTSMAVGALVVGIVSVLGVLLCGGIGLPLSIGAITFGAVSRKRARQHPEQFAGGGFATAGMWCGIVSTALNVLYLGFIAWLLLFMHDP